ncbi:MAG: hypothetical protein GWN58_22460, partial [Anaerolineae bacterium]|nr:hypothetical protein [Anaerolineae bacterium]
MNPAQNVLCSECSGRLPPAVQPPADAAATPAIKGLSLPTKNPAGEQEDADDAPEPDDQTPAWLRELGASISEEGSSDDAEPPEEPEEVPDWLRDLRASLPEESGDGIELTEEADALPDWLTAPESTAAEAEIESDSSEPEPLEPQAFAAEAEFGEEPHSAES